MKAEALFPKVREAIKSHTFFTLADLSHIIGPEILTHPLSTYAGTRKLKTPELLEEYKHFRYQLGYVLRDLIKAGEIIQYSKKTYKVVRSQYLRSDQE